MNLPNKNEVAGKFEQAKGKIKEVVGNTVGNKRLEQRGKNQQIKGKAQNLIGKGARIVGEAIETIGKKIKS
jgi:uncharacterized protein YjbJ (UPF0337 family)